MAENFYLTEYFDWRPRRSSHLDRGLNLALEKLGLPRRARTAEIVDRTLARVTGHRLAATNSGISTSIEQRLNMWHLLGQTVAYDVSGDVVELGCNEGHSAVLMQKVLDDHGSGKALHLYDSFEGLPAAARVDGDTYGEGDLATSEQVVRNNFRRYGLAQPAIHTGWFSETLPGGLPDEVSFAHFDGDLYESITDSLTWTYPRMTSGAIGLVDDYCDSAAYPQGWNYLPGVKRACDDFFAGKPERVAYIYSGPFSHGFFRKK